MARASKPALASEQVGHFFVDTERGRDRLEYTEYGSGDAWVVLLPGLLIPRRMHDGLARALASSGAHVITLDLLGHGGSDKPDDPLVYSMTSFGEQVIALLDHLGAPQAVVGGTSLGANVALEVADLAPDRVRGLLTEMPVLDNALEAAIVAFAPLLLTARFLPVAVTGVRLATKAVPRRVTPFWVALGLDILDVKPGPVAAYVHGLFFGRTAPPVRQRRQMTMPALVIGHPRDPIHQLADAELLAAQLPNSTFVASKGLFEWRFRPERLNLVATRFVLECWRGPRRARRTHSS